MEEHPRKVFDGCMVALTEQGKRAAAEIAQRAASVDRHNRENPVYAYAAQAASQANASLSKPAPKTGDKR